MEFSMNDQDQDRIKRRLAKVLALSQRGVGGEKTNAEAILAEGLAKHGLTVDDIGHDSNPLMHELVKYYTYRTKHDKLILTQCVFRVLDVRKLSYRGERGKKKMGFTATVIDHLEIDAMYSYYRHLFVSEIETLASAFCSKHSLHPLTAADRDPDRKVDLEKQMRILEMMKGLRGSQFMTTKRRLGPGQ
jgi:hypothetical protein